MLLRRNHPCITYKRETWTKLTNPPTDKHWLGRYPVHIKNLIFLLLLEWLPCEDTFAPVRTTSLSRTNY